MRHADADPIHPPTGGPPPRPPATGLPEGGQRRRLVLAGAAKPVARARAFTADALRDWYPGAGEDTASDVVLLVAELVANAMRHAGGPLSLLLHATADRLRIEVDDPSPTLPTPRRPHRPSLPTGHGLFIVQRTSDAWGAEPNSRGKTVWAEFTTEHLTPEG
ncbi:ATP-binding protein [Kitasatospora sp. NPDC096147]|uniref:ATP-binding protein n=1 Tax=Kitasatospora sp. NPDC096147 TaxID=3364093 RepID=UPI00380B547F